MIHIVVAKSIAFTEWILTSAVHTVYLFSLAVNHSLRIIVGNGIQMMSYMYFRLRKVREVHDTVPIGVVIRYCSIKYTTEFTKLSTNLWLSQVTCATSRKYSVGVLLFSSACFSKSSDMKNLYCKEQWQKVSMPLNLWLDLTDF